ncbi:MAG: tRNA1(Val) (adenine(37)-N6)-methyltransferase [Alphaproteobacteria bacterium]|uniref:tRNA1(Val) (Adenine(37)-N6)-methyltransferase n=1 Tax=Candidatus Nitrobium versatile TaxID=2884831 RepID=A0A953M375_9BACT|nr:tRNA1(Val) (adenine(37)-N6)-methyltransferase [Candidatus Nitrobium versatile]
MSDAPPAMSREVLSLDGLRDVRVYQRKDGYRFSVDALLLYSFVGLQRVKSIADIGAGSGIIGLLLARKYPGAKVFLIELQENLARLAERNCIVNGLQDRVKVLHADVKEIRGRIREIYGRQSRTGPQVCCGEGADNGDFGELLSSFDLVVSNPPFRKPRTGKLSTGDERAIARHEIMLPLEDLVSAVALMLKPRGRFCMIHLPERLADTVRAMSAHGLEPKRLRFVHSSAATEAKMVLIEAVKGARTGLTTEPPLLLYNEDGSCTEEMREYYGGEFGK